VPGKYTRIVANVSRKPKRSTIVRTKDLQKNNLSFSYDTLIKDIVKDMPVDNLSFIIHARQ